MPIGILTITIQLPGCQSLKEKRSRLKPLIARLHRQFNLSVAEMDAQDRWSEAVLACALVNSDHKLIQRSLQIVPTWIEQHWPDVAVTDDHLELI